MNLFNYIKNNLSILDVVSNYCTLKKVGLYWKGHCPFHSEKTASFTVSPHKDIFYCFGCHVGGDVISFIANIEHYSPLEAARFLADRYNIDLPQELLQQSKEEVTHQTEKKKRYWNLCQLLAQWCHQQLLKSASAQLYLKNRAINQTNINTFMIGYFPGGLQSIKTLINTVQKKNFLVQDMLEANIICQGKTVLYSPFEERIIFPIKDHLGRFCGFGGRTFKPNDERAKYYNSKENQYFIKGSLLFGFDIAKKAIQQQESAFLVEGYTDCIAMVQHGFENTIATLGTSCTLEHLEQIGRHAQQVFVLYDGDIAGQKAIMRLAELCWQVNLELKVVILPAKEDPASFLTHNGNITECIKKAKELFSFFVEYLGKDFSKKNLNQKISIGKQFIQIIKKIDSPLKQDFLLQKAAEAFQIPFDSLKQELGRSLGSPPAGNQNHDNKPLEEHNNTFNLLKKITELEKKLFSVIINNVKLVKEEDELYLLEYLSSPLQKMLKKFIEIKKGQKVLDFMQFFEVLDKYEKQMVSQLMLSFDESDSQKSYDQLFTQFQKQHWKTFVADIKRKLYQAQKEGNEQTVKKIIADFQTLKKKLVHKELV